MAVAGFVAAFVAVIFFGSNFVPLKKFETGDGIFFQWVFCCTIYVVGIIVNCIRLFPVFYPLPMVGGLIWTIGNTCVVPIVKTVGLGVGLLIWATFNMLSGWVTGRFGLIGLHPQEPSNPILNYFGVVLCCVSAVMFFFIKTNPHATPLISDDEPHSVGSSIQNFGENASLIGNSDVVITAPPRSHKIIGCCLAVFAGTLFGLTFTPVIYIQDNYPDASKNGLDYVFAHFTGIFLTSTAIFVIYAIYKQNAPVLYPRAVLPAMVSGVMWAVADCAWFVANDELSETVSFPIITACPAIIASLWGLYFKEIRGRANLLILLMAILITISGVLITAFSR